MSPYPAQTDRNAIIDAARELIELHGAEQLSLGKVAAALGIKAPSLYGHIKNKNALIQAVVEQTYRDLFDAYDRVLSASGSNPFDNMINLSKTHRQFAHAHPNTYMLAYTVQDPDSRANPEMLLERALALQKIIAQISGEADSLAALRGSLAFVHGFVMLELNGQLRRGGNLDEMFEKGLKAYLKGWTQP